MSPLGIACQTHLLVEDPPPCSIGPRGLSIRDSLIQAGLYRLNATTVSENNFFRIATEPFPLTQQEHVFLQALGAHLLAFYRAVNQLYFDSVHGKAPDWVARYLDIGKPETVIAQGRMNRSRQELPAVIRPDLILTDDGMIATELDAVPGGIGLTACLSAAYASEGMHPVGGADGMVEGFARMVRSLCPQPEATLAIVVSDESRDYRSEMEWLAAALHARGLPSYCLSPDRVSFTEEGLWMRPSDGARFIRIDLLYRFFELFDLRNIPKSELILYAAKKRRVLMTPPAKAYLEEKSAFALFHHPALAPFWQRQLGEETTTVLQSLFPKTWIMDPAEVPPHAVIPGLLLGGQSVADFRRLGDATQKERHFVIKPSGFSELAWGSRGVSVGQDLPEEDWRGVVKQALSQFPKTPYLLQEFHKGKRVAVTYDDFEGERTVEMEGRVRLSPYYFSDGKEARLGGILATICPLDKKRIHGMVDAVMAPCSVSEVTNHDAL